MASVFKRGRWVDAAGRRCNRETPGATWQESRFYMIKLMVNGKPKLVKGYTDRAASEQMAAKLERAKARGEEGMLDPFKPHRGRPLPEHVADYLADLRAKGRAEKYANNIEHRLANLIESCGWKALSDITCDAFTRWRQTLPKRKDGKPVIGPVTQNQYLEAVFGFCHWCVKSAKRLPTNPLADMEKVDESGDVRRARRALSEDEIIALLAASPEPHRSVYRFILATGLRRNQVEMLHWSDLHTDSTSPYMRLRARMTKSRRADCLPLRAELAAALAGN